MLPCRLPLTIAGEQLSLKHSNHVKCQKSISIKILGKSPRAPEALGEARGGAASTISLTEARPGPRFGCASQQSPSDLMALDSLPPRSAGAEELSG